MNNLQIYKASAGSGKTHTLSQDYLKLAFKFPEKFTKILAVTFTNKAAEEMKERILQEINNLIFEGKNATHYNEIQKLYNDYDEEFIKTQAKKIRDYLLHNYSKFSIGTIDSFVQKVIRAFSYEIGIQSGYKIEMDSRKVIKDLIELLYFKIENDDELKKWLIRFAKYKLELGKNWDFREDVANLTREIFKESFQVFNEKNIYNDANNKEHLTQLLKELYKIKNSFESKMKKNSNKAKQIIEKNRIDISSNGRSFKTICNYLLTGIISNKHADLEPKSTIYKALDSVDNWYAKKASFKIKDIIESVFPDLYNCLENAVETYNTEFKTYLSSIMVLSNFHAFGLLNDIDRLMPEYRDDNNLLLISDMSVLLKKIISDNEAPFIYEKIGTHYSNILIDEFQDTSSFQWANFKPLIKESLSRAYYNLIVGDIKQSIYRWRGGDWKLLLHEVSKDIGDEYINEKTLGTNWRSKKNIIDFNNSLFNNSPDILQNIFNNEIYKSTDEEKRNLFDKKYNVILKEAYADSFQRLSPIGAKSGGYVKVKFFETKRAKMTRSWRENLNEYFPNTIDDLLKNKNYQAKDIAVLVRKNKDGKQAVDMLLKYMNDTIDAQKYDIISAESLYIGNSKAIQVLIASLKFLYNEKNQINLIDLIHNHNILIGNDISHYIFDFTDKQVNLEKYLPASLINNTNNLRKLEIYELVEKLIEIYGFHNNKKIDSYIRAFQDAVLNFTRTESADIVNFLNWWDDNGHQLSVKISDKQNAVNIMTIHKSKGLAFRVVIIPFCDWPLESNSNLLSSIIWTKSDVPPFNKFKYLPLKYNSSLSKTIFYEEYYNEKLYSFMDALNMMYVAFTRPKDEIIIMAPIDKKSNTENNISDILYKSITTTEQITDNDKIVSLNKDFDTEHFVYENNNNYIKVDKQKYIREKNIDNSFKLNNYPTNDWRKRISIKYHSHEFFIKSIKQIETKVNYGTLMHKIFAKINTKNDIDNAIEDIYMSGMIDLKQKNEIKNNVIEIVNRPHIVDWFSEKWEIITEKPILNQKGQIKIPDRILKDKNKTIVIDFKFGEINDEYQKQINEYIDLLKSMGEKNVEGYLYYADKDIVKSSTNL